jgi:nicotinamidase-related amidase
MKLNVVPIPKTALSPACQQTTTTMASTTALPNQAASYGPSETALPLLDLQKFIFQSLNDLPDAKEKLYTSTKTLLAAACEHNVPMVHCTIDINRQPLPTSKLAERWADTYEPSFKAFPEGVEEDDEFVAPRAPPTSTRSRGSRRDAHLPDGSMSDSDHHP